MMPLVLCINHPGRECRVNDRSMGGGRLGTVRALKSQLLAGRNEGSWRGGGEDTHRIHPAGVPASYKM